MKTKSTRAFQLGSGSVLIVMAATMAGCDATGTIADGIYGGVSDAISTLVSDVLLGSVSTDE